MRINEFHDIPGISTTPGGTLRLALAPGCQSQPKGTPRGGGNTWNIMKFIDSHESPGVFKEAGVPIKNMETKPW